MNPDRDINRVMDTPSNDAAIRADDLNRLSAHDPHQHSRPKAKKAKPRKERKERAFTVIPSPSEIADRLKFLADACANFTALIQENNRAINDARTRLSCTLNVSPHHRKEMLDNAWTLYRCFETAERLQSQRNEIQQAKASNQMLYDQLTQRKTTA
jgi:hypothetical protein